MLKNLPPWLESLLKSAISLAVLGGSYWVSQGAPWTTMTLGGALLWLLHYLDAAVNAA